MILQGVALMITGMVTVYFFLWLLVVSIQISERVIRFFETRFYQSDNNSPKPEVIAAISAILFNQQTTKR
jgi:Na+-transporting methylmalonyl-CoA/oxaloacetate decarboxylase gamma subunit